jgi:hypothetical protein
MSAPNNEGNLWLSIGNLLYKDRESVATLATAIEKFGIQTYDRFGRRVPANDDSPDVNVRKARALDLLASYYSFQNELESNPNIDPDSWYEYDSPLQIFGWPTDEAPEFDKIDTESAPDSVKPKGQNIDSPVPTRARRTYLTIIAALCKSCGIYPQDRGAAQRIKESTEALGYPVDDGTIQAMLKDIPDALEARSK